MNLRFCDKNKKGQVVQGHLTKFSNINNLLFFMPLAKVNWIEIDGQLWIFPVINSSNFCYWDKNTAEACDYVNSYSKENIYLFIYF